MLITVFDVEYEPHRAAQEVSGIIQNPERLDELNGYFTDDFIGVDRRSLVAFPDLDAPEMIEMLRLGHEAGLEQFDNEYLAARGERLILNRVMTRFADGSVKDYLTVVQWNPALTKCERQVRFDVDDLDAALAELDRLHTEIDD